jgi:hypothetical protein
LEIIDQLNAYCVSAVAFGQAAQFAFLASLLLATTPKNFAHVVVSIHVESSCLLFGGARSREWNSSPEIGLGRIDSKLTG